MPALPVILRARASLPWLAATLFGLAGCKGNYAYVFNDNVVYSPAAARNPAGNVFRDAALQGCLNQFLEGVASKDLDQVKLLACPGSGVEDLGGIDRLPALEQLELSDNKIRELGPLARLKNLRVLGLRNNPVTSLRALDNLQLLRFVTLQGDDQLHCDEISALKSRLGNTLTPPDHCSE